MFGLGNAADYLLESVYWLNRADLEEFESVWLNNVSYVLGDISPVPGGGAFIRRIMDYPTGWLPRRSTSTSSGLTNRITSTTAERRL